MAVYLSPVGANVVPAANQLRVLAVFKEKLCKAFCTDYTVQPQTTVTYKNGTPRLVETTISRLRQQFPLSFLLDAATLQRRYSQKLSWWRSRDILRFLQV